MIYLYKYILYFFIYAFLGWCCECVYCSLGDKKVVNRGFLNGPICPIYGFGALAIVYLLNDYIGDWAIVFTMGLIMTSILEYVTSVILEFLFHSTWWDYSNRMFNINGRVCLKNSILFGIMSVVLMEIIHPMVVRFVENININYLYILVFLLILYIIIDISITLNSLNKLRYKLERLEEALEELKKINIHVKSEKFTEENILKSIYNFRQKDDKLKFKINDIYSKIANIKKKSKVQRRILKAFPNMNHKNRNEGLKYLKQMLRDKTK